MAEVLETQGDAEGGIQRTLKLKSDQWGIFGPTFKIKIPVTDIGGGEFKVAKADWDATIGPIFDRMRENIDYKDKTDADRYRAIGHGYAAMDSAQTRGFHKLLCAFECAADPSRIDAYPGTMETNSYKRELARFAEIFNGPAQAILVTQTQLEGLATAARGAMEYLREGDRGTGNSHQFYDSYLAGTPARYSNGIVNALT